MNSCIWRFIIVIPCLWDKQILCSLYDDSYKKISLPSFVGNEKRSKKKRGLHSFSHLSKEMSDWVTVQMENWIGVVCLWLDIQQLVYSQVTQKYLWRRMWDKQFLQTYIFQRVFIKSNLIFHSFLSLIQLHVCWMYFLETDSQKFRIHDQVKHNCSSRHWSWHLERGEVSFLN